MSEQVKEIINNFKETKKSGFIEVSSDDYLTYLKFKNKNGQDVGEATLSFEKYKGIDYIEVESFDINEGEENKGYGNLFLKKLNDFIRENKKIGILQNSISDPKRRSFYENRGWKYLSGHTMIYNATEQEEEIFYNIFPV